MVKKPGVFSHHRRPHQYKEISYTFYEK